MLWAEICSTRRSGAVGGAGCDRREVSRQRVHSNLGFVSSERHVLQESSLCCVLKYETQSVVWGLFAVF